MGFLLVGEDGGGGEDLGDVISGVQCGAFRDVGHRKSPDRACAGGGCVLWWCGVRAGSVSRYPPFPVRRWCANVSVKGHEKRDRPEGRSLKLAYEHHNPVVRHAGQVVFFA